MTKTAARVLPATEDSTFSSAAAALAKGGLVAFPTETVYGLGAHGLDEAAVLSIYKAKGRPLTDPVILHVATTDDARPLLELSPTLEVVFEKLTAALWPGPITLVAQASERVPSVVCAGTGFVGVRCPSHPIAHKLLATAGLPVAAPSANRFGHVSPTSAAHVVADLGQTEGLLVVDGGRSTVGVESSVVKLVDTTGPDGGRACDVVLLRRGAVVETQLQAALAGMEDGAEGIRCCVKLLDSKEKKHVTAVTDLNAAQIAPGQLLKHYAPELPTFLIESSAAPVEPNKKKARVDSNNTPQNTNILSTPAKVVAMPDSKFPGPESYSLSDSIVVDFGGHLVHLRERCKAYRDMSPAADFDQAAFGLFDCLRWTETQEGASNVLLYDVLSMHTDDDTPTKAGQSPSKEAPKQKRATPTTETLPGLGAAVYDRMYRAASGRFATLE